MARPSFVPSCKQGSSDHHLGPRGSLCGKNERDNPSNVRNTLAGDFPLCHLAPNASKSSEIQILLAYPVLLALSATQIASLISKITSFSTCANLKLDAKTLPIQVDSSTQFDPSVFAYHMASRSLANTESVDQVVDATEPSPRSPSVDSSTQFDPSVFAFHMASRSLANTESVDQAVDATEPSPFRPALLPDYIPVDAKSYYYWQMSLDRVNHLRDNLLSIVTSFNGEIASYFAKLKGPRLKSLDFTKHPFPFPALLGLRKLHAFLSYSLFEQQGTLPLTPSEAAEYDDYDNEFDIRWSFEESNYRNFRNASYVPAGNTCSNCSADGASSRCTRCKIAVYCDRICQGAHWKVHKATCTPPPQAASSPAASGPSGGA